MSHLQNTALQTLKKAVLSVPSATHGVWFILEIFVCAVNLSPGVMTQLVGSRQHLRSQQQMSSASTRSRDLSEAV